MLIEDGFEYHLKIAIADWIHDSGIESAAQGIAALDDDWERRNLARALLDRAESYMDLNSLIEKSFA